MELRQQYMVKTKEYEKSAQRLKHCAHADCSKVRTLPARPPTVTNPQTGPITIQLASTQCN